MYNYLEAMKNDVMEYINDNTDLCDFQDREDLENKLNDDLFIEDSVTGNASGTYTFNTALSKEYVQDNLDLLKEAAQEFGCTNNAEKWLFEEAWEDADVTIRCYLLGQAINAVLDDMENDNELNFEE